MPVSRGEVWTVPLDPVRGHEQGGMRPALVVSDDLMNHGPSGLVMIIPFTSTIRRHLPIQVLVEAPEGGLNKTSTLLCDQLRTISSERIGSHLGRVTKASMEQALDRIKVLLNI